MWHSWRAIFVTALHTNIFMSKKRCIFLLEMAASILFVSGSSWFEKWIHAVTSTTVLMQRFVTYSYFSACFIEMNSTYTACTLHLFISVYCMKEKCLVWHDHFFQMSSSAVSSMRKRGQWIQNNTVLNYLYLYTTFLKRNSCPDRFMKTSEDATEPLSSRSFYL